MHNKYANNDKIRQQRAEKICNNIEIFYERKKCMVAIFTLQLQLHPAIISPSPDIPKKYAVFTPYIRVSMRTLRPFSDFVEIQGSLLFYVLAFTQRAAFKAL